MAGRTQLLVIELQNLDAVASATESKEGSVSYVDVELEDSATTIDVTKHLGEGISIRDPPKDVDVRIVDDKQPSTGIVTT